MDTDFAPEILTPLGIGADMRTFSLIFSVHDVFLPNFPSIEEQQPCKEMGCYSGVRPPASAEILANGAL